MVRTLQNIVTAAAIGLSAFAGVNTAYAQETDDLIQVGLPHMEGSSAFVYAAPRTRVVSGDVILDSLDNVPNPDGSITIERYEEKTVYPALFVGGNDKITDVLYGLSDIEPNILPQTHPVDLVVYSNGGHISVQSTRYDEDLGHDVEVSHVVLRYGERNTALVANHLRVNAYAAPILRTLRELSPVIGLSTTDCVLDEGWYFICSPGYNQLMVDAYNGQQPEDGLGKALVDAAVAFEDRVSRMIATNIADRRMSAADRRAQQYRDIDATLERTVASARKVFSAEVDLATAAHEHAVAGVIAQYDTQATIEQYARRAAVIAAPFDAQLAKYQERKERSAPIPEGATVVGITIDDRIAEEKEKRKRALAPLLAERDAEIRRLEGLRDAEIATLEQLHQTNRDEALGIKQQAYIDALQARREASQDIETAAARDKEAEEASPIHTRYHRYVASLLTNDSSAHAEELLSAGFGRRPLSQGVATELDSPLALTATPNGTTQYSLPYLLANPPQLEDITPEPRDVRDFSTLQRKFAVPLTYVSTIGLLTQEVVENGIKRRPDRILLGGNVTFIGDFEVDGQRITSQQLDDITDYRRPRGLPHIVDTRRLVEIEKPEKDTAIVRLKPGQYSVTVRVFDDDALTSLLVATTPEAQASSLLAGRPVYDLTGFGLVPQRGVVASASYKFAVPYPEAPAPLIEDPTTIEDVVALQTGDQPPEGPTAEELQQRMDTVEQYVEAEIAKMPPSVLELMTPDQIEDIRIRLGSEEYQRLYGPGHVWTGQPTFERLEEAEE